MSGGRWCYAQRELDVIIGDIEDIMIRPEQLYINAEKYELKKGTIACLQDAIKAIEKARIYINRVDWFFSGDDGEDDFVKRLKSELNDNNTEQ